MSVCPFCDGAGERYREHPSGDPALEERDTCTDCGGTGEGLTLSDPDEEERISALFPDEDGGR